MGVTSPASQDDELLSLAKIHVSGEIFQKNYPVSDELNYRSTRSSAFSVGNQTAEGRDAQYG